MMESITCQKCGEVCDLAISKTDFSGRYVSTCCGAKYDYMLEESDMQYKYTSIRRNFRGFNFQTDYYDPSEFERECLRDAEGGSDTEWALLFNLYGKQIAEYKRGAGVTYNNPTGRSEETAITAGGE